MTDFRVIPSIEQLRQRTAVRSLELRYGREALVAALRESAAALRQGLARGERIDASEEAAALLISADAERRLASGFQPSLRRGACPIDVADIDMLTVAAGARQRHQHVRLDGRIRRRRRQRDSRLVYRRHL